MTSTIRPAPPPKPSHLSSAFTSTFTSDALRSYIRQQSINTITSKQQQQHNDTLHIESPFKVRSNRIRPTLGLVNDDGDEEEEKWGTAKQQHSTPTKLGYCKLASLFNPDTGFTSGSRDTIKPLSAARLIRESSEESSSNISTIKISRRERESLSSSPLPGHARGTPGQTSYSSSSMGTERSRQPSILSRLSVFSDDDYDEEDYFFTSMQQETPKKKWMHVRDGSAFERAGPKTLKESTPSKVKSRMLENSVGDFTELVAGPPPLRPYSIVMDLSGEVGEEHSENDLQNSAIKRKAARALYPFTGEVSFNELSLTPGQSFDIVKEDVGGGWSLATARDGAIERRGLVPRGWYTYIQEFATSPALTAPADSKVKPQDEPPAMVLDQQKEDMTVVNTSPSSILSRTFASTHDTPYRQSESSFLSPKDAWQQQKILDPSRPASGIGQVYSEAGAAMQALTQMQRSSSVTSYIASKSGTSLLQSAIKESDLEEIDVSKSSLGSEGLAVSTSATSISDETEIIFVSSKSASVFASPWKTPVIFGGRSLHRFTPFVTSGAEEYVLFGKGHEQADEDDSDRFDVVSGNRGYPTWKHPGLVVVAEVHSPEVHTDEYGKEYTAYVVYSSYVLSSQEELDLIMLDPHVRPLEADSTSSVYRRFNQFRWLSSHLGKLFPVLMLSMPPFPSTSYGARFDSDFVQRRRRQLQTWLLQVVRHPILSNEVAVRFFLDSEEEGREWNRSAQNIQQQESDSRDASTIFFAKTFHPLFNVDILESQVDTAQMNSFCDAYQKDLMSPDTGILASFKGIRQTTASTSDSYRQMSYSLLRLITGSPQIVAKQGTNGLAPMMQLDNHVALPPMGNVGRRDANGATNEERAWCWREGCKECKRLTRSVQGTAEALQIVADFYENHSNGGLFDLHNRLATMAKLNSQHTSLMEVHKATLVKYRQATGEEDSFQAEDGVGSNFSSASAPIDAAMEQMAARCESVVNVTMSEMDRIHTERCQDWNSLHSQFLDMQIDFYEDVLSTLKSAKSQCNSYHQHQQEEAIIASDGPILPSPYESHLAAPHHALPLLQTDASHSSSSYFSIWK